MRKPETVIKEMKHNAKQIMKRLASNRGLTGYKSLDNDELVELLNEKIDGFNYEENFNEPKIVVSWYEANYERQKYIQEFEFTLDLTDQIILKDNNQYKIK